MLGERTTSACAVLGLLVPTVACDDGTAQDESAQESLREPRSSEVYAAPPELPAPGYFEALRAKESFEQAAFSANAHFTYLDKLLEARGLASFITPSGRVTEDGRDGAEAGPGEGPNRRTFPSPHRVWAGPQAATAFVASIELTIG